jgi:hypothetical protein
MDIHFIQAQHHWIITAFLGLEKVMRFWTSACIGSDGIGEKGYL